MEPEDEASGRRTENRTESRLLADTMRATKYWEPIHPHFFFLANLTQGFYMQHRILHDNDGQSE